MSDRGVAFLFGVLIVLGCLGTAAWLLATGQAGSVDGIFLLLTSLTAALVFSLYLAFMIRRAMEEVKAGATAKAKASEPAPAKHAAAIVAR